MRGLRGTALRARASETKILAGNEIYVDADPVLTRQAIFRTNEQKIATGQERVFLISPFRLDVFLRVALTILAAVLLLLPVVILFELQPTKASQIRRNGGLQILTIFLFTLLFSASCSIFTKARRQEVFTATAAYSAVLVVFLGSTLNTYGGP